MQLKDANVITPAAIPNQPTSGTVIGHGAIRGWDGATKQSVHFTADVVAGPLLATGVTDIRRAASDLIARGWSGLPRDNSGLVGFVRRGDTWDAVALLAPELPGGPLRQLWSSGELQNLRLVPGVQLDAIWQVSDYGGDMHWRTPNTFIPELR